MKKPGFIQRFHNFLGVPRHQALFNLVMLLATVVANMSWQVFCIPVPWAIGVLTISFASLLAYPFFWYKGIWFQFFSFLNGINFCILIYCIIFMGALNFYALFLLIVLIGIIAYSPHILVFQLAFRYLIRPVTQRSRYLFLAGIGVAVLIAGVVGFQYRQALDDIEAFKESDYTRLQTNYFTERILGMHFIYHTQFCEWDGWRPPKHDPFLVLGMWLHPGDPLEVTLKERVNLYKQWFPDRPVKFSCSCAREYSDWYHRDELWKE